MFLRRFFLKPPPSERLPVHIGIIMDGNGRWAKKRGLPRIMGHRAGVESVREIVEACGNAGVKYLTLYTFSVENWKRPEDEVKALMDMLKQLFKEDLPRMQKNNVRLKVIGRVWDLPSDVQREMWDAVEATRKNTGLTLVLALNYGGRAEVIDAVNRLISAGVKKVDEEIFRRYLYDPEIPDPDLIIRTSGEIRLSNFLLWESAYSELWFTNVLWPDFRKKHLYQALWDYASRERRFGGV